MKERLKDPMFWTSILSTIFIILSAFKIIEIPNDTVNVIINSVISVLAMLGIVRSPKNMNSNNINQINNSTKNDINIMG